MRIASKKRLRFRCFRRGHRWYVYLGDEQHEVCERCGKRRLREE